MKLRVFADIHANLGNLVIPSVGKVDGISARCKSVVDLPLRSTSVNFSVVALCDYSQTCTVLSVRKIGRSQSYLINSRQRCCD